MPGLPGLECRWKPELPYHASPSWSRPAHLRLSIELYRQKRTQCNQRADGECRSTIGIIPISTAGVENRPLSTDKESICALQCI